MQLHDTMFDQYNGFAINTENILCAASLCKDRVVLPYTGDLPPQFDGYCTPEVRMVVKPGDVRLQLVAYQGKSSVRAILDADHKEIVDVLDKFFQDVGCGTTGLSPFWEGTWFAHYIDWKRLQQKVAA